MTFRYARREGRAAKNHSANDEAEVVAHEVVADGPNRAVRAGLVVIVILPVVVAAIRAIRRDWFPIGDSALLYLRTADVFTRHHPFLGSWTSASISVGDNMNNPGPAYDWLIAPFAHVLPPGPGAALGVGAVNLASIVGISSVSRRIGGWTMQRWMLAAAAALSWAMGSELLIDIFQAHALMLPFLLFLVLLTGCSAGDGSLLPLTVGVGTLLIQTHISYAYILSFLILMSIASFWWSHRPIKLSRAAAAIRSRPASLSLLVFIVLWAYPIWEEFFGEGRGNLTRLVANASGGSITVGMTDATRITGSVMTVPWWWMRQDFATKIRYNGGAELLFLPSVVVSAVSLLLLGIVLAALTVAAHRRGLRAQAAAGALAVMSIPATVLSLSRLTIGPTLLSAGHIRWVWSLAVFGTFVALWLTIDVLHSIRFRGSTTRWPTAVAVVLATTLSVSNFAYHDNALQYPKQEYRSMPALRRAFPKLRVLAAYDPVLFDTANLRFLEAESSTMMMWMQELGIEFRVTDEGFIRQLGPMRRANGSERVRVFQLEGAWALTYSGPACAISLTSALSEQDEKRAAIGALDLAAAITDGTIVVDATRLGESDHLRRWMLGLAIGGNLDMARTLVVDGTLSEWFANGMAVSSNRAATAELLEFVMTWVQSSYGFFAEGIDPCPVD